MKKHALFRKKSDIKKRSSLLFSSLLFSSLLFSLITIISCNKSIDPPSATTLQTMNSQNFDSNFVTEASARYFAARISNQYLDNLTASPNTPLRSIKEVFSIPDKNNKTAAYIINYSNDDGYIVMSADYRYPPLLTWSTSGNFDTAQFMPSMLIDWYAYTVESIEMLRDNTITNVAGGYASWSSLLSITLFGVPPTEPDVFIPVDVLIFPESNSPPCGYFSIKSFKNPLIQTTWGQGVGFNDALDYMSCETFYSNGRPPTGCVATAMAQLIKYWQPPNVAFTTYDYSNTAMPLGTSGSPEIQRLMKDCGEKVSMDYNCNGSGAYSNDAMHALAFDFGFSKVNILGVWSHAAQKKKWNNWIANFDEIKTELDANRPVYLDGCANSEIVFLGFKKGTNCHAWLTDGYRVEGNNCYTDRYLHMNWGWADYDVNAYYYFNHWQPNFSVRVYNTYSPSYYINIKL